MSTEQKIPEAALCFASPVEFKAGTGEDGKTRTASGVAYSGEVVTGHWYWDAVVFDINGIERPKAAIPLLIDHDSSKRAGFTSLAFGSDVSLADARLLSNEHGCQVARDADQGFPWQLSVFIQPTRVEQLRSGEVDTINGREVRGPATVFRASRIREVSFTPTGADHNTSASVFSSKGAPAMPDPKEPTSEQTIKDLQSQVTKLSADLEAAQKRADEAEGREKAAKLSARTDAVKSLFSALKRELKPEAMQPYIDMTEEQFSAISADLTAAIKPAAPTHLFSSQVGDGKEPQPLTDPSSIAAAAAKFKAEQASIGNRVSDAEAVAHVMKGA